MSRFVCIASAILGSVSLVAPALAQSPLGSDLTYQGRLTESGSPVEGSAAMRFWLYDAASGGNVVAGPVDRLNVPLAEGLFTVELDFGAAAFGPDARWLEIEVNTSSPGNPCGDMACDVLSPRQKITAAPIALALRHLRTESTAGAPNVIGGDNTNVVSGGADGVTIGGGLRNSASGGAGTVAGGQFNQANGASSAVGGGVGNIATGQESTIPGGTSNRAQGRSSFAAGVLANAAHDRAFVWSGDNVDFTSTAAGQFLVRAPGGVGIGTNSPSQPLHVRAPLGVARLDTTSSVLGALLELRTEHASPLILGAINFLNAAGEVPGQLAYEADHELTFRVNGLERMRIDSSGDVGIGVSPPNARLHVLATTAAAVANTATFEAPAIGPNASYIHYGAEGDWYIRAADATGLGKVVIQDTLGPVTIGTTNPLGSKVNVAANDPVGLQVMNTANNGQGILVTAQNGTNPWALHAVAPPNTGFAGRFSGRVYASGSVGIGTESPAWPLHVSAPQGVVRVDSTGTQSPAIEFRNLSSATNVTLGTLNFVNLAGLFPGQISYVDDEFIDYMTFRVGGNERVRFTGNGNVGIGTIAPSQLLSVNGSAGKPGGGDWSVFSDERLKQNITPMPDALDRLMRLHGYEFEYTADAVERGRGLPGRQIGLIAQEVQRVFPDWVEQDADGYLFVTERATTALMVESLRQLRTEQDAEVAAVRAENEDLRARLNRLEARLDAILGQTEGDHPQSDFR
ncbi:MAG: tail fiber domain-containing protein [Phycisphaerae bacterium]